MQKINSRSAILGLLAVAFSACGGPNDQFDSEPQQREHALVETQGTTHRVLFERGVTTHAERSVDAWETRDPDLDIYVQSAVGIEVNTSSDWAAHVEAEESDHGDESNEVSEIKHVMRVIVSETRWLSRDERLAEVKSACQAGEMSEPRCADRYDRLSSILHPTPRPALSDGALEYLASMSREVRTLFEACGPRIPRAFLPERSLLLEIAEDLDRQSSRTAIQSAIDARAAAAHASQQNLAFNLGLIEWLGIPDTSCIQAAATADEIVGFAGEPGVEVVYVGAEVDSDSHGGESTLPTVRSAIQAVQFHDAQDTGAANPSSGNSFSRLTLAVNDAEMNEDHRALRDNSTASRVVGEYICNSGSSCTIANIVSGGAGTSHGMRTLGIAAGDLLDGQDPSFATFADRNNRTGIAPEAGLVLLEGFGLNTSTRAANTARALRVDVMNLSDGTDQGFCPGRPTAGNTDNDYCTSTAPICSGFSNVLKDAINLAFEDGVFYVKSAGNSQAADSQCTCTVTNPGDAEGAFPVAALTPPSPTSTDQAALRNALVATTSSEGGGEMGGLTFSTRERTLIGLAAPTNHSSAATCEAGSSCNTFAFGGSAAYASTGSGTSFAAPVVAGAAVAYKDRWISWGLPTTWLDNAGNMRMQMLLQGDRVSNDGTTKLAAGYSTKYGAGRLKMRHRSDQGMDAPWLNRSGYVNINDGQVWTRWISGDATPQPVPSDADSLVIVGWWFEPEMTTAASDIIMYLDRFDSTCTTQLSTVGDYSLDNRKRIHVAPNGNCWRIRVTGVDVTPTSGQQVRTFYWAYSYEDNDRDDTNGPSLSSPPVAGDVELP